MRHSLTARLVATAVALVALVCVLIGTVTAVAMRQSLMSRLDSDVRALTHVGPGGPDDNRGAPGTLTVVRPISSSSQSAEGFVLSEYQGEAPTSVSQAGVRSLASVPTGAIRTVTV